MSNHPLISRKNEYKELISEARIVMTDEIKDIKDFILCGICYQVALEERCPVECASC